MVWDGLDFAFGPDPTPGETRVTAPVTFNHGANLSSRTGPALDRRRRRHGGPARQHRRSATTRPSSTCCAGSDGLRVGHPGRSPINIPANVGTTTVQMNSAPVNQNPDSLLWEVAALRVRQLDTTKPTCPTHGRDRPAERRSSSPSRTPAPASPAGGHPVRERRHRGAAVHRRHHRPGDRHRHQDRPEPERSGSRSRPPTWPATSRSAIRSSPCWSATAPSGSGRDLAPTCRRRENKVTIINGDPGLQARRDVGQRRQVQDEEPARRRGPSIDIASAMRPGDNERHLRQGQGTENGSATIMIWDGRRQ